MSTGKKPQRPAWHQLAVFLRHYGAIGGRHHIDTARDCGVAQGSVYEYIDRVIIAIRSHRRRFLHWPRGDELEDIKDMFAEMGFPNCIGAIDGSLIKLTTIPLENSIVYYCRKKTYAVRSRTSNLHLLIRVRHRLMSVQWWTQLVDFARQILAGQEARMISQYTSDPISIFVVGCILHWESIYWVIEVHNLF